MARRKARRAFDATDLDPEFGIEFLTPEALRCLVLGMFPPGPLRFFICEFDNRNTLTIRRRKCLDPDKSRSGSRERLHPLGDRAIFTNMLRPQPRTEDGDDHSFKG